MQSGLTGTSFADTGLTDGTTYYYQLTATAPNFESARSSEVSATPNAPPPAVTGAQAKGGSEQVVVSWTAVAGAASYTLLRGSFTGGEAPVQTALTGTSFTDTGLTDGQPYYYEVLAVGSTGVPGPLSAEVTAMPLAAPGHLKVKAQNGQAQVSWAPVSGASGYSLYRSTTPGGEGSTAYQSSLASPGFTDTGLTNGTTYYYQVTATATNSESSRSVEGNTSPGTPPAAPITLAAVGSSGQVVLTWTAPTGAASYIVYRGESSGGESTTPVAVGVTGSTWTDTGVTNGMVYFYEVTAVNAGGVEGVPSNEASTTPLWAPPVLILRAGNGQVTLDWSSVDGAVRYNLYRSTAAGQETLAQSAITTTTFTDSGLTNGTTYYYQLTAAATGSESARSPEGSATPLAALPTAPTGVAANGATSQVTVTWTAVAGATSYRIYRSSSPGIEGWQPADTGVTGTTWTDTALSNGMEYYYEVTAINNSGESAKSAEVHAVPVTAPWDLAASAGTTHVTLSWSPVIGATSYSIFRSTTGGGEGATPVATSVTGGTWTDSGLTNGTTYYYQVVAIGDHSQSGRSTEVSGTPAVGGATCL